MEQPSQVSAATDMVVAGLAKVNEQGPCESCGLPHARNWATRQGKARLCQQCATLHGLGCP